MVTVAEVAVVQTVVASRPPPRNVQEFCLRNGITPFPKEFIRAYKQQQIQKLLASARGFDQVLAWASPVLRPLLTTVGGVCFMLLLALLGGGLLTAGLWLQKELLLVVSFCLIALYVSLLMVMEREVLSGWRGLPYMWFAQNHPVPTEVAFLAGRLWKPVSGRVEVEFLGADPILKTTDRQDRVCYLAIWDQQEVRIGYRAEEV